MSSSSHRAPIGSLRPLRTGSAAALFALAAGGALALGGAFDELTTRYAAEASYRVEHRVEVALETVDMRVEQDGRPVDLPGGMGGSGIEETWSVSWTDRVEAVDGARPSRVLRTFEELDSNRRMGMAGRDFEQRAESPFDGVVLRLERDGAEVVAKVEKGGAIDGERLEGHRLELGLDGLLPARPVAVGDDYEIDGEAWLAALAVALHGQLFEAPRMDRGGEGRGGERGGRGGRGGFAPRAGSGAAALMGLDWEITARRVADSGGLVQLRFEARGSGSRFDEGRGGESEVDTSTRMEAELSFDPETSRPVAFRAKGRLEIRTTASMGRGDRGATIETTLAGPIEIETLISGL